MGKATRSLRAGERGYTLVELLVVLTVISLLIAVTSTMVSSARPGAEGRAATRALVDALRAARSAAISSNTDRVVLLDLAKKTYVAADGKAHQLPDGVEWEFQGPARVQQEHHAELRFFPDGSSGGGRIRILSAGQTRVIVDHRLTGRISIDE